MLAQEVAKKYSTALFNIVREKDLIDEAFDQFEELDKLIKMDKSLLHFLRAPHILDQHKVTLLKDVFSERLNPLFLHFILVLVSKHRINFLHEIIMEFRDRVAEAQGKLMVKVTSAVPLSESDRVALIARLAAKTGKKIELIEIVDPAILGGMIIVLGDQIIDGSVRYKLSLLKNDLMKLKVN